MGLIGYFPIKLLKLSLFRRFINIIIGIKEDYFPRYWIKVRFADTLAVKTRQKNDTEISTYAEHDEKYNYDENSLYIYIIMTVNCAVVWWSI